MGTNTVSCMRIYTDAGRPISPLTTACLAMSIAGFHRYTLVINGAPPGRPLRTGTNWRQPDEFDVAGQLRPGANRIEVTVFNSNGPPALWLSLDAGTVQVSSGEGWETSYAGAVPGAAILASAAKPMAAKWR